MNTTANAKTWGIEVNAQGYEKKGNVTAFDFVPLGISLISSSSLTQFDIYLGLWVIGVWFAKEK